MDLRRDQPGRGAWIHPDPACVQAARRRRALERAMRARTDNGSSVWVQLEAIASQAANADDRETEAGWKLMGTR